MGYHDVLAKFLGMFPNFMEQVKSWTPGQKSNNIKISLTDGQKLLFTYYNDKEWELTAINGKVRRV